MVPRPEEGAFRCYSTPILQTPSWLTKRTIVICSKVLSVLGQGDRKEEEGIRTYGRFNGKQREQRQSPDHVDRGHRIEEGGDVYPSSGAQQYEPAKSA